MPYLNESRTKHRMAEAGIRDAKVLAQLTGLPWGALRNAVCGRDPIALDRVYTVARAVLRPDEDVKNAVRDILATTDDMPDEPLSQPKRQEDAGQNRKEPRRAARTVA